MAQNRKKLSPSQIQERDELESFLTLFFERFWKIDVGSALHPVAVSRGIAATHGELSAFSGLKMATNDCLEFGRALTTEQKRKFDIECHRRGALTMSALLRTHSNKFRALVKRGKIRNETEYQMVAAVLSDTTWNAPPEQALLEQMVETYENARRS